MHVLLIEDDVRLGTHIQKALQEQGHIVDREIDGRAGLISASSEHYDAIILDRMLPKVDGLKILQTLRATGDLTPILMLSAMGTVEDKVAGLRAGGDDYMSKPFALSELLARVDVLGRKGPANIRPMQLTAGDIVLDIAEHTVRKGGVLLDLTPREFRVLEYLMSCKGRVVTRSMLLESAWDYSFDPHSNVIDQYIAKLRTKIDPHNDNIIQTVRGVGYRIKHNNEFNS